MKICPQCNTIIVAKNRNAIYCSQKCRNLFWRKQHPNYDRIWYENHPEAKKRRIQWNKNHPEKRIQLNNLRRKTYYRNSIETVRKYTKEYDKTHKGEIHARHKAYRKIIIGDYCQKCGSIENLERHHSDYNQPLIVQTLCAKCHVHLHKKNGGEGETVSGEQKSFSNEVVGEPAK